MLRDLRFVALKPGTIPMPRMRDVQPGDSFAGVYSDEDALRDDLALGHIALVGTPAAREVQRLARLERKAARNG